jgi:hypothetical protein
MNGKDFVLPKRKEIQSTAHGRRFMEGETLGDGVQGQSRRVDYQSKSCMDGGRRDQI